MTSASSSTIAAVATGPAAGGIGVIRLSGPGALAAARAVAFGMPLRPEPRRAIFTRFGTQAGEVLDEGLVLYFQRPHSYTGEDVVELQAHGSQRLLSVLLARLVAEPGVRLAEPGEFTRRAFLNGRLDLARAEAVADLIAADSEAAVRAASAQLKGGLSHQLADIRGPLVDLHADLEAALDFPDEADEAEAGVATRVNVARAQLAALLATARRGALVRRGAKVVLFGPVNAGKSTLFNRLVGESRALVDPEPGTTRDVLEAQLEWSGLTLTLVDTAGLRADPGRLEAMGIERARAAVSGADVAVLLAPASTPAAELESWAKLAPPAALIRVLARADEPGVVAGAGLAVSGASGLGIECLRREIESKLQGDTSAGVLLTSERHVDALRRAAEALERAAIAVEHSTLEVVAGEVGLALAAMSEVTGEDVSTELLDAIFRRFCIGK